MKKLVVVLLMAVVLLFSGCTTILKPVGSPSPPVKPSGAASPSQSQNAPAESPASADERSAADYFPVRPNVRMTYQGSGNEFAGFVSTVDYIGNGAVQIRTSNGGTETVTVYTVGGGAVSKVFSDGEIYYRQDYTAERSTISESLIKNPIAVGTSWQLSCCTQRSITGVDVPVTVPYGSFKALEVTSVNTDSTTKEYYASGVGLIKRVFTMHSDPSSPVTSELEKFEDGSPLSENTRFYYPDFNRNRVAYIDKTLDFYTGDTVASKFADEFRRVPQGSGLTPLLTTGAVIKSVVFDKNSGVVTIDLSEKFITEMNAGASLEGLILESLADTLGHYYHTTKVAVTIEGGPYESGHFLFNKGDFLPVQTDRAVAYRAQ